MMERLVCVAIGYLFGLVSDCLYLWKAAWNRYPQLRKRQCGNDKYAARARYKGRTDRTGRRSF